MIVIPPIAATADLDFFLESVQVVYHLYTNDYTPDADTTLESFVEANWPGYTLLLARGWTPALWQTDYAIASADPLVWTLAAPISPTLVWGYYVTDWTSGSLLWCERVLTVPIPVVRIGDTVTLLPEIRFCQGCLS